MSSVDVSYEIFLKNLDKRLELYKKQYEKYICCKEGCSYCCEQGDYPISELELLYMMKAYSCLDNELKTVVQRNIKSMEKGLACPFLHDKKCLIYKYRPIICRVHGLSYFCKEALVKVPYCVNIGLNYSEVYEKGELLIEPISENLDTKNLLENFNYGEIRNLYDWIKDCKQS